jgi:molybdopterin molybdotransferase
MAAAALRDLAGQVDVLVTSGGISAGAYEVVKDVFGEHDVEFVKVAMQPGMPQGCGQFAGRPVVTLPGNPVSVLVSFELFVRPLIRRLAGHRELDRPLRRAVLAESVRRRPTKQQYLRVVLAADGSVTPVGGTGSHLLGALARANALLVVPPGEDDLPIGAEVEVLDLAG